MYKDWWGYKSTKLRMRSPNLTKTLKKLQRSKSIPKPKNTSSLRMHPS